MIWILSGAAWLCIFRSWMLTKQENVSPYRAPLWAIAALACVVGALFVS